MGRIKRVIIALFLGLVLLLLFSALGPAFFGVLFLFLLFWLIWRFRSRWHLKPADRNNLIVLFLAEQYGDIIQWDQSNRAYIMTHGVSGIDWKHYKHPLPEKVYDVYMQYWKEVDFSY